MTLRRKNFRAMLFGVVLLAIAAACLSNWWYLFGSERITVEPLGSLTLKRSWGRIEKVEYDHDRDGSVDAVEVYRQGFDPTKNHQTPDALAVDTNHDGALDMEFVFEPGEGLVRARVDSDGDGEFDQTLEAADAARLLDTIRAQVTRK